MNSFFEQKTLFFFEQIDTLPPLYELVYEA